MLRERRDVLAPLAHGRHDDPHDVEAVQQVEPEARGRHFRPQVAIGRGDDADVDAAGDVLAHAPQLPFLNDAQHLGLRARRQLADLVEKERAAVRLLEDARGARRPRR